MANSFEEPDPFAGSLPAPTAGGPAAVDTARRAVPPRRSAPPLVGGLVAAVVAGGVGFAAGRRRLGARDRRSGPRSSRRPRRR